MLLIPELLESNFTGLSINDFIVTISHLADKAETHIAFQGITPEYVTLAPKLREIADGLGQVRDAASGGDRGKMAEKKQKLAFAQMAVTMNAQHIVMLSICRNDPGILIDAGYDPKQKSTGKVLTNLLEHVPDVFVKHAAISGSVIVLVKRAKAHASIELQMTDQDPNIEASWGSLGMFSKSRIELKGLVPASKMYFRARYHEEGGTGNWSSCAGLIIL